VGWKAGNLEQVGVPRERDVGLVARETLEVRYGDELERSRIQGHERSCCEGGGMAVRRRTWRR
jgi:hypothetical protein